MLSKEKQMEVLEAYDLTESLRGATEPTGVDRHTVARYVAARVPGGPLKRWPKSGPPRAMTSPTRSPSGLIAPTARLPDLTTPRRRPYDQSM